MDKYEAVRLMANGAFAALKTVNTAFGSGFRKAKAGFDFANEHYIQKSAVYASNRWPASYNFTYKSSRGITRLLGAGVSITDPVESIRLTAYAASDFYSAVFETMALAFRLPKGRATHVIGGASALTAVAFVAGMSATMEFKDSDKIYAEDCPTVATLKEQNLAYTMPPPSDRYFADERVLDYWSSNGWRATFNLLSRRIPFNPDAVKAYKESERVRGYIDLAVQEAIAQKLDPALFVNMLFQESAKFNLDFVSGDKTSAAGAIGIAQFKPDVAKSLYGLSLNDLKDWKKAIPAAAVHLATFADKFNSDPVLMLAAYNGGEGSIEYVQQQMGRESITGWDWLSFNKERRNKMNQCGFIQKAWHNETTKHVSIVTGHSFSAAFAENAVYEYDDFKRVRVNTVQTEITPPPLPRKRPEGKVLAKTPA